MPSVFDVAPYDGGWCVKIVDTGEVMFFAARRRAIAAAHDLACRSAAQATVRLRPRLDPRALSFAYALDASA